MKRLFTPLMLLKKSGPKHSADRMIHFLKGTKLIKYPIISTDSKSAMTLFITIHPQHATIHQPHISCTGSRWPSCKHQTHRCWQETLICCFHWMNVHKQYLKILKSFNYLLQRRFLCFLGNTGQQK